MTPEQLAERLLAYRGLDFDGDFAKAAAELRRLAAENTALRKDAEELRGVLHCVRRTLDDANQIPNGPICDTIWYTPYETLFDFIDAALEETL